MKHPLIVRTAAIAAIAFALLLPLHMIGGKVVERQATAQTVTNAFMLETSAPQVLAGPFLVLTCEGADEACEPAYFAPRTLDVAADVPVESLHRGIYAVRMYRASVQWRGEVEWPARPATRPGHPTQWTQAYLVTKIRDPRGVKAIESSIPGSLVEPVHDEGVQSFTIRQSLGGYGSREAGTKVPFAYRASIAGMGSFKVMPVGDTTEIRMASNWPHPDFSRAWSPDDRAVSRAGFTATWRINSMATGGDRAWKPLLVQSRVANLDGAGVSMFDPVNVYTLSHRATEYAFLFILFTFAALGATEALEGVRLHPVQYALVGCALAIFFLLLLALSEHVHFAIAYAAAAVACASLVSFYLRHALGTRLRALGYFAGLLGLYATLYAMLQSEDNALLVGSLLVFALLATIMVATRKIDWGDMTRKLAESRP